MSAPVEFNLDDVVVALAGDKLNDFHSPCVTLELESGGEIRLPRTPFALAFIRGSLDKAITIRLERDA